MKIPTSIRRDVNVGLQFLNLTEITVLSIVRIGPPTLTVDRTIFEMWLALSHSPKSVIAGS